MDRRGWRVLHLAAHGDVDFATYRRAGDGHGAGRRPVPHARAPSASSRRARARVPQLLPSGRVDAAAERQAEVRYPSSRPISPQPSSSWASGPWSPPGGRSRCGRKGLRRNVLSSGCSPGPTFGEAVLEARERSSALTRRRTPGGRTNAMATMPTGCSRDRRADGRRLESAPTPIREAWSPSRTCRRTRRR